MADLYFKTEADYTAIVNLQTKISQLENTLRNVNPVITPKVEIDKMEKDLFNAKLQFSQLTLRAADAGARMSSLGKIVRATGGDYTKLASQIRSGNDSIRSASQEIGILEKSFMGMKDGFASFVGRFGAAQLAMHGLNAIISQVRGTMGTIMSFEAENSRLAAIAGMTSKQLDEMTQSAMDLGRQTVFTASQVTSLQIELAKLGFQQPEIKNMQESVLAFAQATGASLADAASTTGAVVRMFGAATEETSRYVGAMASATMASALDFRTISENIAQFGPVAHQMGMEVEDALALFGALKNAGVNGSTAATSLRNIMNEMAGGKLYKQLGYQVKSLDDFVRAMKDLESAGYAGADGIKKSMDAIGKRGGSQFLALINQADKLGELRDRIKDGEEGLGTMGNKMINNLSGQLKILQSAWEGLVLQFRGSDGVLKDVVGAFADGINKITDNIEEVSAVVGTLISTIALIKTASFLKGEAAILNSNAEVAAMEREMAAYRERMTVVLESEGVEKTEIATKTAKMAALEEERAELIRNMAAMREATIERILMMRTQNDAELETLQLTRNELDINRQNIFSKEQEIKVIRNKLMLQSRANQVQAMAVTQKELEAREQELLNLQEERGILTEKNAEYEKRALTKAGYEHIAEIEAENAAYGRGTKTIGMMSKAWEGLKKMLAATGLFDPMTLGLAAVAAVVYACVEGYKAIHKEEELLEEATKEVRSAASEVTKETEKTLKNVERLNNVIQNTQEFTQQRTDAENELAEIYEKQGISLDTQKEKVEKIKQLRDKLAKEKGIQISTKIDNANEEEIKKIVGVVEVERSKMNKGEEFDANNVDLLDVERNKRMLDEIYEKKFEDYKKKNVGLSQKELEAEHRILEAEKQNIRYQLEQQALKINDLSYSNLMVEKQEELNQKIKEEAEIRKINAIREAAEKNKNENITKEFEDIKITHWNSNVKKEDRGGFEDFKEYLTTTIDDETLESYERYNKKIADLQSKLAQSSQKQRDEIKSQIKSLTDERDNLVANFYDAANAFTNSHGDLGVMKETKEAIDTLAKAHKRYQAAIAGTVQSEYSKRMAELASGRSVDALTAKEIHQAEEMRRTKMSASALKEELLQITALDGDYTMRMNVIMNTQVPKWMKDQFGIGGGEDGTTSENNLNALKQNAAFYATRWQDILNREKRGEKVGKKDKEKVFDQMRYYSTAYDMAQQGNDAAQQRKAQQAADEKAAEEAKKSANAAASNEARQRREREKAFEKSIYQFAQKRIELNQKYEDDVTQASINAMKEGSAKTIEAQKFEHDKKIREIEKQGTDEVKAYWDELSKIYNADPEHMAKKDKDATKKSGGQVGKDKNEMIDFSIYIAQSPEKQKEILDDLQGYFDKIKEDTRFKNLNLDFDISAYIEKINKRKIEEIAAENQRLFDEYDRNIKKYQDFEMRINDINKKYNDESAIIRAQYEALVQKGVITEEDEQTLREYLAALKELEKKRNKEVFDEEFNHFKEQPEYYSVFQNTAQSSTEDIKKVYDYLESHQKEVMEMFKESPKEMRAYFDEMEKLFDELVKRDPFDALKKSTEEYKEAVLKVANIADLQTKKAQLETAVSTRKAELDAVKQRAESESKNGKVTAETRNELIRVEAEFNLTTGELDKVSTELNEALIAKQALPHLKKTIEEATDAILDSVEGLVSGLEALANEIGGVVGEITSGLSGIFGSIKGNISTLRGEGMSKTKVRNGVTLLDKNGNAQTELTTQGKLAAAQMVMQVAAQSAGMMKSMFQMADDAASKKYEKFASKQAEWNKMSDAVYDYRKAVLQAELAEKNWFSSTGLGGLRDAWKQNQLASESYFAKLNEQQAKYKDKKSGISKAGVIAAGVAAAAAAVALSVVTFGAAAAPLGAAATAIGSTLLATGAAVSGAMATAATVVGTTVLAAGAAVTASGIAAGATVALAKYNKQTVAAIDNLKIETRKKTFWKGQKTENVAQWAKKNLGIDLFGKDDRLDVKAAEVILDKYGDKLQGEAQATLQQLVDLQKEYDEFEQQLKDYVSQMYSPLVDDMTDAIMTWLDTGQDALYTFKQSANQTFRDVAKEMVKELVTQNIFGTYSDDIKALYQSYASGGINEGQLAQYVADMTADLEHRAETMMPALQTFTQTLSDTFNQIGVDITDSNISQGSSRGYSGMSQEVGESIDGRMAAIQISNETIAQYMMKTYDSLNLMNVNFESIGESMSKVDFNVGELLNIQSNSFLELKNITQNTYQTAVGMANMRIEIQKLNTKLENL